MSPRKIIKPPPPQPPASELPPADGVRQSRERERRRLQEHGYVPLRAMVPNDIADIVRQAVEEMVLEYEKALLE